MISDVPLGAFLSGGLDSSIVVGSMSQQSSTPVKTFFIDFQQGSHSEREFAAEVAKHYRTDHHELLVDTSHLDMLDSIIEQFDEPFGDSSAIPTYYVSKLTREHVTVALSGDGGDESFGGYRTYLRLLRRHRLSNLRQFINPLCRSIYRLLPPATKGRRAIRAMGDYKLRSIPKRNRRNGGPGTVLGRVPHKCFQKAHRGYRVPPSSKRTARRIVNLYAVRHHVIFAGRHPGESGQNVDGEFPGSSQSIVGLPRGRIRFDASTTLENPRRQLEVPPQGDL